MKKKIILLLASIYLGIFVIMFFLWLIGTIFNNLVNYNILIYYVFILLCISLPIITLIYYFYINQKEVKKYEEAAEKEYQKNKNYIYYRDKIKGYSPGVLAYCYNKKYEFKKIFMATLLDLSLNNYIKFENNKIIVLNDDCSKLSENEKYILELIKNNSLIYLYNNKKSRIYFKSLIEEEAINNFFEKIKNKKKYEDYYNKIFAIIFIGLFIFSIAGCAGATNDGEVGRYILLYALTFICGFIADRIFKKLYNKLYKRNNLAIDVSSKLTCIKKFINEFTNLKNKSIKEIELWEDYMIYVFILDIDGKINDSVNHFINDYIINN